MASLNIFRLETSGVVMVCLSYLDASSPAHMRYSIRRLRRRLPEAKIVLGCWLADVDAQCCARPPRPMSSRPRSGTRSSFVSTPPAMSAATTDAKAPKANVDAA